MHDTARGSPVLLQTGSIYLTTDRVHKQRKRPPHGCARLVTSRHVPSLPVESETSPCIKNCHYNTQVELTLT